MTAATATREAFRPAYHYASTNTWLNDPNGLVFHNGTYHLYYQNNPFGNVWGNMSWGHATSTDLLHWDEQPVAIPCDAGEDIFSGSIVVDSGNTSGFGDGTHDPLVAIYTSAFKEGHGLHGLQAQSLAWSTDGGYTWTKYAGNPVLNRDSADFRDPKVFRYDGPAGSYWVMAAVEAADFQVVLYRSDDLRNWDYLSSFGPANATGGVWECPDLFPLPVDGDPATVKWVLTVNLNPGGPNGGSAGQYFVGEFDGVAFRSETTVTEGLQDPARLGDYHWLDWGRDYYAAVSFSNVPDGRRLMIGWMNNWDYGNQIPSSPWRSPMSLVREVSLTLKDGRPRLVQRPAEEVLRRISQVGAARRQFHLDGVQPVQGGTAAQLIEATFTPGSASTFGLVVRGNGTSGTRIGIDPRKGELTVDRTGSGDTSFHQSFPSVDAAPLEAVNGSYTLQVFVDHCSVEIFANDGALTMTQLIFPSPGDAAISLYSAGGTTEASVQLTGLA